MVHITHAETLPPMKLRVTFDDGVTKVVDVAPLVRGSVFEQDFKDPAVFNAVRIYENGRGVFWPDEFDLCPDTLRFFIDSVS